MAVAAATRNPLVHKVSKITSSNEQQQKLNATLLRELAELREEKAVMVKMFQDQLDDSRKNALERLELQELRSAALVALQAPEDEHVIVAEAEQLQEELQRVRTAGKLRLEQKSKEVFTLKADLAQRRAQLERLRRANQAIGSSADADLEELELLHARVREFSSDIEDLESENLKTHCQVEAWGMRLSETQKLASEAEEKGAAREVELLASLDSLRASAEKMRMQLNEANDQCEQLKLKACAAAEGSMSVKEGGAQTRYLSEYSEQTRLREQVEKLTEELERVRTGSGSEAPGIMGALQALCLRPRMEDPNAPSTPRALGPSTPRASLRNAASEGSVSARARRPLVV